MAGCDIDRAVAAVRARTLAAIGEGVDDVLVTADEYAQRWRLMLVGTGLEFEHVAAHAGAEARRGLAAHVNLVTNTEISGTDSLLQVLAGVWAEGLLGGLIMAEQRAAEQSQIEAAQQAEKPDS